MRLLVSACLLGVGCRYDGGHKLSPQVTALIRRDELVPVCPEQLGGLPTPRPPCERSGGRVLSQRGEDRTEPFLRGAREALRLYHLLGCEAAILKSRSPSCGRGLIYDGSFTRSLTGGNGVFCQMLLDEGVKVYTEEEVDPPKEE